MSRASKVVASSALLALSIAASEGLAQPRSILPAKPIPDLSSVPDADMPGSPDSADPQAPPPPARPPANRIVTRGPAVEVGDLGTIEGPVAGLFDDASGGLGYGMWTGINRATAASLLQSVPAATPSEATRLLLRKVLLTSAPPPAGTADLSFNALRVTKLIEGGLADDAADLALKMDAPMNGEILRAQTDALLFAGRDMEACGDLTSIRLQSAEPFWAELRAYCYALSKDTAALDLTRSVIDEQGIVDPAFLTLLDGMVSGKAAAPEVIRLPDALQLLILQRLKLPVPGELGNALGLSANLALAGSAETAKPIRVAAAETALRAGVLPTPLLREILDLSTFSAQEAATASALARGEPVMTAMARLRSALKAANRADLRAEIIHTALQIGEREGLLPQTALLFADDAEAILPPRDWGNWSDLMMRGLLLAGRGDAAARWYEILNPAPPAAADMTSQLELALALASPDATDTAATQANLGQLALKSNTGLVAATPATISRATLALGLYDALGLTMPPEAKAAVEGLVAQQSPGRRPAPVLMQRIERAASSGARGETALAVIAALGVQGTRDLAPDIVVRLVRALEKAGIRDAGLALATEAMLLRSPAGG